MISLEIESCIKKTPGTITRAGARKEVKVRIDEYRLYPITISKAANMQIEIENIQEKSKFRLNGIRINAENRSNSVIKWRTLPNRRFQRFTSQIDAAQSPGIIRIRLITSRIKSAK